MISKWKGTLGLVIGVILLMTGCQLQPREVSVYKEGRREYTEQQAQKIVEKSFFEDIDKRKVQGVEFFDEGIIVSYGQMINTQGTAVAGPIGGGAIISGKSRSISTALGSRIYYSSIGNITVYGSARNDRNRYLAYIYHKDGRGLKKVYFLGKEPALEYVDAMYSLVKHYNERQTEEQLQE